MKKSPVLMLVSGAALLWTLHVLVQKPAPDLLAPATAQPLDSVRVSLLDYPDVGTVRLLGNQQTPAQIALYLSGDGGWDDTALAMASALAQDGKTLVVGVDLVKYYQKLHKESGKCLYPAGNMEGLSEFVQKELHLPKYHKPVLTGYSAGATLTYALLCQAPAGTFSGGIALSFCPEIETDKPFCEGSGKLTMTRRKDGKGFDFTDKPAPSAPLEVLHGNMDQVCDIRNADAFFNGMSNVRVTRLPGVGHGFSVVKNWLPQFRAAFARLLTEVDGTNNAGVPVAMALADSEGQQNPVDELPLSVTPAQADNNAPMVLFLSGDGGWTGFDQQICNQLAQRHWPSIGLNSQSYFWKKKTPEQVVADVAPVMRQYMQRWNKQKWVLAGYSFGADIVPFLLSRLPDDLRKQVQGAVLLSPDKRGDFEIHVTGMMGIGGGPYDVVAEVKNVSAHLPVLCVRGEQEDNDMESALPVSGQLKWTKIPGSHHYDNDAGRVATTISSIKS